MDIYDCNDDNLSMIARSCNYFRYGKSGAGGDYSGDLSCSACSHWNGKGCSKKHLEGIASEMQLG